MGLESGNFFLLFSTVQATKALSQEILGVKCDSFCFALADVAQESPARLLMLQNKGLTTAE